MQQTLYQTFGELPEDSLPSTMAASYRFDLPPRFSFKPKEWEAWIADFKRFRRLIKLHNDDGETNRDTLLYHMGTEKAEKIMSGFKWMKIKVPDPGKPGDTKEIQEVDTDFEMLVGKFNKHFIPSVNIINESTVFNKRVQGDETVEEYATDLQKLVISCDYKDPDRQVRDRLVVGL